MGIKQGREALTRHHCLNAQLRHADVSICPVRAPAEYLVGLQQGSPLFQNATRCVDNLRACLKQPLWQRDGKAHKA